MYCTKEYYFTNDLSAFSGEQMYWQERAGNKFKTIHQTQSGVTMGRIPSTRQLASRLASTLPR